MRCDEATIDKTRLGYARILIEVEVGQKFPERIFFKDEKGSEVCVPIDYDWKPDLCTLCKGIGHTDDMCKKKKESMPIPKKRQEWRHVVKSGVPVRAPTVPVVVYVLTVREQPRVPVTIPAVVTVPTSTLSPVTVVSQQIRQEHQSASTSSLEAPKSPTYAEVLNSPTKSLEGRLDRPPELISTNIKEVASGNEFMFTVVYGSNDEEERLNLWNDLKHIKDSWVGPWCICGDFNNLLDFNERLGRPVHWSDITEFRDCVDYCEVVDIKAQGAFFTWNNKQESSTRVYSRLDRFMINGDWL
ncbi:uncharacterized protein LOC141629207 [Silene latifolia]|uniref:uncharacterized protein LOC141629207 n=1 Tax=Silene latifolia TaxID=37657 RepID=UPI003D775039